jgi:hypothetical protein
MIARRSNPVWIAVTLALLSDVPIRGYGQDPPANGPAVPLATSVAKYLRDRPSISIPLPAAAGRLVVGGNGRFLLVLLPQLNELAVFDVAEGRVTKRLPFSTTVQFAAGRTRFVVWDPSLNKLTRYRFDNFQPEGEVIWNDVKIYYLAMGSASEGPVAAVVGGEERTRFFDLSTFRINRVVTTTMLTSGEPQFLRASPDGKLFTGWDDGSPTGLNIYRPTGTEVRRAYHHKYLGPLFPGSDGKIYTSAGVFLTTGEAEIETDINQQESRLPAVNGKLSLLISSNFRRTEAGDEPYAVTLRDNGGARLVRQVTPLPDYGQESFLYAGRIQPFLDERIVLVPDAELLITLPTNRDRLVLSRFKPPGMP